MPDVDMSTLVTSEVNSSAPNFSTSSSATSSATTASGAPPATCLSGASNVIKREKIEVVKPQKPQPLLTTIRNEAAGGQAKMTLGQMALAGIVISSGPGDHFETYEGTFMHSQSLFVNDTRG